MNLNKNVPLRENVPIYRGATRQKGIRRFGHWKWALLVLPALCALGQPVQAGGNTTTLTATEARVLVYISPVGEKLRASGLDIAMEQQTSPQLNQANYYYFWVYNAKRRQSAGSVTIGYYAVNKHTGQIWDTDEKKEISSKLVRGVQAIIRRSHHIDEATTEKYANRPF